ncbi:hypothetical protein [Demequina sp. NBRC 110055]|uniref:hypothetical protein n=1 Tax=Demequina sp. NBRC 110055 TaxID=1570344 RepID=UPI0011864DA8|nr:hypothetical protein [Demequina sp. NBRC 110055]
MTPMNSGTAKRTRPKNYLNFKALGPKPFPQPKREWVWSKEHGRDVRRVGVDYGRHVLSWLTSEGLRTITREARETGRKPAADDLALTLYFVALGASNGAFTSRYDDPMVKADRTTERLEELCDEAAASALEFWSPQDARRISHTARKAGQAFRKMQWWDLDRAAVAGRSKREQAAILGVSTATIAIYRRLVAKLHAKREQESAWTAIPASAEPRVAESLPLPFSTPQKATPGAPPPVEAFLADLDELAMA